jgi:branched-chain amino acid transport system permease protein
MERIRVDKLGNLTFQDGWKQASILTLFFGVLSLLLSDVRIIAPMPAIFIVVNISTVAYLYTLDTAGLEETYVSTRKLTVTTFGYISVLMSLQALGHTILVTEIIIFMSFYAIVAISLNMSTGLVGVLNFGVIAQILIGAITLAIATVNFGVPLWIAILLSMISSAIFSGIIALTTLRLRDDYFAIVSITLGEIFRQFLKTEPTLRGPYLADGGQPTTPGILNIPQPFAEEYDKFIAGESFLAELIEPFTYRLVIGVVGVAFLLTVLFLSDIILSSPYGRVLRSIREDELVTSTYGKHLFRYKVEAMMISGAIAGLGGAVYAWIFASLFPEHFQPVVTFFVWVAFIIGGRGNNKGMIAGSMVFVFMVRLSLFFDNPDFFLIRYANSFVELLYRSIDQEESAPFVQMAFIQLIIVGLILILFIRFSPRGLIPEEPYRPMIGSMKLPLPGSQAEYEKLVTEGD